MSSFTGTAAQFSAITTVFIPEYYERPQWERSLAAIDMAYYEKYNSPEVIWHALGLDSKTSDIDFDTPDSMGHSIQHRCSSAIGVYAARQSHRDETSTQVSEEGLQIEIGKMTPTWIHKPYEDWRELLRLLINRGANIHAVTQFGRTPLMKAIGGAVDEIIDTKQRSWAQLPELANSILKDWLNVLAYAGVNLNEYGGLEKLLHNKGFVNQDLVYWPNAWDTDENIGKPPAWRLVSFSYGHSPDDWHIWGSEPTDEFAGTFWKMVERSESLDMPGAFIEDENEDENEGFGADLREDRWWCMRYE